MMSKRWGELPVVPDTESGIAAIEREQMIKPRPMDVEGPELHQPSSKQLPPNSDPHPAEYFAIDSVTMHTIKLIQHAKKLRTLIHNTQQILESAKTSESDIASLPDAPPVPDYEGPPQKHCMGTILPFMPKVSDSDFARGIGKPPPEIDGATCHQVLRKSVTAICAHAGFDSCSESILDVLTDLCSEYFMCMTRCLRHAVDNEAIHGTTGFQDVMQQVFHEMGVGSITTLHSFYQSRILNYHNNMKATCDQLMAEYEGLLNPDLRTSDDKASIRVKDELMSDIKFPTAEEAEEMLDPEQLLQLGEGLGLDINMVQDTENMPREEDQGSSAKGEATDNKRPPSPVVHLRKQGCIDALTKKKLFDKVQSRAMVAMVAASNPVDSFEQEELHSSGAEFPPTPRMGSDTGDSLKDPGSEPSSDIMSPPAVTPRPKTKKNSRQSKSKSKKKK